MEETTILEVYRRRETGIAIQEPQIQAPMVRELVEQQGGDYVPTFDIPQFSIPGQDRSYRFDELGPIMQEIIDRNLERSREELAPQA